MASYSMGLEASKRVNFRCSTYVKGVVVVPQRLEVGEDSLKIVDSFHYLGDVISYGGGV